MCGRGRRCSPSGPSLPVGADEAVATVNLSPSSDHHEAAANFFAGLQVSRFAGPDRIAVMPIPDEGLGEAINDRLRRAAAPRG